MESSKPKIRKAVLSDVENIMTVYGKCVKEMRKRGIN